MKKLFARTTVLLLPMLLLLSLGTVFPSFAYLLEEGSYEPPVFDYTPAKTPATVETREEAVLASSVSSFGPMEAPPILFYQVLQGDTLYKIARDFDITVKEIVEANGIINPNTLQVGQKLHMPIPVQTVAAPDGTQPVVGKVLNSTLTAYTAGKESTGKTPSHPEYGITYSGSRAEEGRTIAVDPKVIPLGSTVFIEGIGLRKAEDTGSAIRGAKIDVFMNDVREARNFGVKKNVKVYVLKNA